MIIDDDYIIIEYSDVVPPGTECFDVDGLRDTTPGRPIMAVWRGDKPGWVEYSMAPDPVPPKTWKDRLLDTSALCVLGTSSVVGLALLAYQWLTGGAR